MRQLTTREKRTLRFAGIGISLYLLVFFGGKFFTSRRAEYQKLVVEAQGLRRQIQPYEDKAVVVKKLMEHSHLDPAKLSRATVVAETSSAIQKAAAGSGMQVGPVRESPARSANKELATVQLEGSGPIPSVLALLNQMESLGYPVVVDSIQITPDNRPGQIKVTLSIVILDFEQWKKEQPHA